MLSEIPQKVDTVQFDAEETSTRNQGPWNAQEGLEFFNFLIRLQDYTRLEYTGRLQDNTRLKLLYKARRLYKARIYWKATRLYKAKIILQG